MSALIFIFMIFIWVPSILTQDSRSSAKHYCYVQSPIDLSIFNLTTIQRDDYDTTVRITEFEYLRAHFCRPLKDPCNGKHDYAVCLHSNDKEIGAGKEPPKVVIDVGKLTFKYTGDKCNKTHNYTVDIDMKCNFAVEKIAADLDIVYNRDQCSFQMSIESLAACSKRKQTKCDLRDKTGHYDLSPLMNLGSNYMIKLNNSSSVILNICHSLIYGQHFEACDHGTMVCLVDETNTKEPSYTRLGNVNDDMRFSTKNGNVHLDLTSDTPCNQKDANGLKTVRTTIEFICQKNATKTIPQYLSGLGTCHYKFRWLSTAACSQESLIKQSIQQQQPCSVFDPVKELYYELSVLEGSVTFVNSSDNTAEYQFSVCTPLKKSNCTKSGTGICKYIKGKNIAVSKGQANTKLMWKRDYIYLNYTDGTACGNNRRSYTVIIFKCSHSNNTLIVDDDYSCATIITWASSIVCKNTYDLARLLEILDVKNLFHWRLLTRPHANYVVQSKSKTTQYHLNVGIPLVEDQFTVCTNNTGICKVVTDNKGRKINEINLGSQEPDEHTTIKGRTYLNYVNGSICEDDRSRRISTEVTFICDFEAAAARFVVTSLNRYPLAEYLVRYLRMLQGTPKFIGYFDCKYYFDWTTSHICVMGLGYEKISEGCRTANTYEIFNFTYLMEKSIFNVYMDENSGHLSTSFCKDKRKCDGVFVCDIWKRLQSIYETRPFYAKGLRNKVDFTNPLVVFKFANESQCRADLYYHIVIEKWCELWDGIAELFYITEDECTIGLDWDKHISACQPKENVTEREKENDSTNIRPNNSVNVPPTDTATIPPTDSANIPPTVTTNIPQTVTTNIPPTDSANIVPTDTTNIPPTDSAIIPPTNTTNISPTNSANIPPTNEPDADHRIYITTSLVILIIIVLVVLVALGIVLYKWKRRRVVSSSDTHNPVVSYSLLNKTLEPTADMDME